MRTHEFKSELWLPAQQEQLFAFFADAGNLEAITPPWLHFQIVTPAPIAMRVGTLIDYRLRVHGLPMKWRSLISRWDPPASFVDEQVYGPYRLWVHEHTFESGRGGTWVRDSVRYAVPLDRLLHRHFIRPDIEKIFAHRTQALRERFA